MRKIYLIGSLRNPIIPEVAIRLRTDGHDVFDDWWGAGESADDAWQAYEKKRGRSYKEALKGYAAQHICAFDRLHLNRCDTGVLIMPAGKSAHSELGYIKGLGNSAYVLFDKEPERYDVMYNLFDGVFFDVEELAAELKRKKDPDENWRRVHFGSVIKGTVDA